MLRAAQTGIFICLVALAGITTAQELAPRAYWPAPVGTNLLLAGYQYSSGDVLTDPTIPVEGVEANLDFALMTYLRTFSLAGRSATAQLNVPYTWGEAQGFADGSFRSREISAIADARARLSVNLVGAPAMDREGFQKLRANPTTIVGASLLVSMPTGGYNNTKIFNAGSNRWAIKPAIGVIYPLRPKLLLEFEVGAWVFEDNDDYLGSRREQDPVVSAEFHIVKRIRPGFWASLDLNHYAGGRTKVDGVRLDDRQENSRVGATLLWPFKRQSTLRVSASTALSTSAGGDFDIFTLAYIYIWN